MIEFVAVEVETAYQGADGAVLGVRRNESRFHRRHLCDAPVFAFQHDADDGAAFDFTLRRRFVAQQIGGDAQAGAADTDFLARGQ